jgi:light-regulated signal transduction histidine kinase (bacteriophytochrome)
MNKLIIDLLGYARLGRHIEPSTLDCNALFNEVMADLAANILETKATIKVGPLPTLKGFKTEIRLLFQNLLSNALKYHKAGIPPEITFTAQENVGKWLFAMQDNGIGIDPRFYGKIFMLFQRLHNREDYSGTGIGLAECKKIVELHDGDIWVNSVPGEGSTFYFTLASQSASSINSNKN